MSNTYDEVHVYIEIPALYDTFEAVFTLKASFEDNLSLFFKLIENRLKDTYNPEQYRVYEKTSLHYMSRVIPLINLGIHDGMTFIVY